MSHKEGDEMTDFNITPPFPTQEQEEQWWQAAFGPRMDVSGCSDKPGLWSEAQIKVMAEVFGRSEVIRRAIAWATPIVAQLAADAELEACVNRQRLIYGNNAGDDLRAARRQEPKSKLQLAEELINHHEDGWVPSPAQWHAIREGLAEGRRALESIPDNT